METAVLALDGSGMLDAERQFRPIIGYRDLAKHVRSTTPLPRSGTTTSSTAALRERVFILRQDGERRPGRYRASQCLRTEPSKPSPTRRSRRPACISTFAPAREPDHGASPSSHRRDRPNAGAAIEGRPNSGGSPHAPAPALAGLVPIGPALPDPPRLGRARSTFAPAAHVDGVLVQTRPLDRTRLASRTCPFCLHIGSFE